MTLEKLRALAEGYFEWESEDRSTVTTTSALLFAQYALAAADKESASALRDTFAAVALHALLLNQDSRRHPADVIAADAFLYADQMLRERGLKHDHTA
jgi:hypothetical protein